MEGHFKRNPDFKNVYVKGEVSNKFISASNHLYFTLKDKRSQISCIVYSWFRKNIKFDIEDGMKLLVTANVSVYPPHGKYQLDVRAALEDGLGQLFVKYQQLKKKLGREGLFDKEHKKYIPRFPKSIGVITSREGSVIHDIIRTVKNNWPYCQVILFPAAVQGANSKRELITQIRRADSSGMDVLIVARGGGSIEDLWSYNEEELVRTIFACKTPLISAVGHESDVTLTDLVADKRASTPTMAASMAVENKNSIMDSISHYNSRLIAFMSSKMDGYKKQMNFMLEKSLFSDSTYVYNSRRVSFDDLHSRFDNASRDVINSNRMALEKVTSQYVIKHPCKMQVDTSRSNLNELQSRLINSMENILKTNRVNLDKVTDDFNFSSKNILLSKRHELDIVQSVFSENLCFNRIDVSRNGLNLMAGRLTDSVDDGVSDRKRKLDKLVFEFTNVSKNLVISKRHEFDMINSSFSENLCLDRIVVSRNNLNLMAGRLTDSVDDGVSDRKRKLDKLVFEFSNASKNLVMSKRYELGIIKSSFSENLCLNKIDGLRIKLDIMSDRIATLANGSIEVSQRNLDNVVLDFTNASQKIILNSSYRLDSIRSNSTVKNPERIYESKRDDLTQIRNNKIIKNPYIMLEPYRNELKIQKEKLDKINSVIMLKKEQKQQKQTYIKIIAVIVVVMIIVLIMILGGIL